MTFLHCCFFVSSFVFYIYIYIYVSSLPFFLLLLSLYTFFLSVNLSFSDNVDRFLEYIFLTCFASCFFVSFFFQSCCLTLFVTCVDLFFIFLFLSFVVSLFTSDFVLSANITSLHIVDRYILVSLLASVMLNVSLPLLLSFFFCFQSCLCFLPHLCLWIRFVEMSFVEIHVLAIHFGFLFA